MPIEDADYISELDSSLPLFDDPLSQSDDHKRLIKKVLLQSFPGVNAAVTLTAAQLNAVLLSDEDGSVSGTITFEAAPILDNLVSLLAKESGGTTRSAVIMNGSNVFVFGDASVDAVLEVAASLGVSVGGDEVAEFVGRANGGLLIADSVGTKDRVMAVHLKNTITGQTRLANNVAFLGLKSDGTTEVDLVKVDTSGARVIGAATDVTKVQGSTVELLAGANKNAEVVGRTSGSLLVGEHDGTQRRAGYRDPSTKAITTGPYTAVQADEGRVLSVEANSIDVNLPTLDQYTTFTIIVEDHTGTTITNGTGVTAIEWLSGGVLESGTSYDVEAGSVVQARYRTTGIVQIWGNGISKT